MFFKVINYNCYKNPQKKRCGERWKKLKKISQMKCGEFRWGECVGFIWCHRWYTHIQKMLNVIMTSPWIVKPCLKPTNLFSVLFFRSCQKKKKSLASPWHWLKCFAPRIVHIPGTHEESSPQLTCLFIRNSWFMMDSPFTACLFLSTSHTAQCKEMIC